VPEWQIDTAGFDPEERLTIDDHRWWSVAELDATAETVYPENLADLLRQIVAAHPSPAASPSAGHPSPAASPSSAGHPSPAASPSLAAHPSPAARSSFVAFAVSVDSAAVAPPSSPRAFSAGSSGPRVG
jgi:hypothetical protein